MSLVCRKSCAATQVLTDKIIACPMRKSKDHTNFVKQRRTMAIPSTPTAIDLFALAKNRFLHSFVGPLHCRRRLNIAPPTVIT